MIEVSASTVPFFQFPHLAAQPGLVHAISARGSRESWNMSYSVSKKHGDPLRSRMEFLKALGLPMRRLAVAGQVHGNRVQVVTGESLRENPDTLQHLFTETDGLVTEETDLTLLVTAADCPPVFFFDPKRPAIGIVHSGWRGTWAQIALRGVETMRENFRSDPCAMRAAVGPGIGACCYEVGEDLIGKLGARERNHLLRRGEGWVLDLASWIVSQIQAAGIPAERIERSPYCTACHRQHFFSHRAEKGDTGRVAAVMALRRLDK